MKENTGFIAKTFQGLEAVLADELHALGASDIQFITRGVSFSGDRRLLMRACLGCRTALRILVPLAGFSIRQPRELYDKALVLDWPSYFPEGATFAVDSVVKSRFYTHSHYPALLVKDAVADCFRKRFNRRPDVDAENPGVRLHVHVSEEQCTLALDASGESLHKRGYRLEGHEAPLNEALAAGLILLSQWDGRGFLLDPMCGSGTILVEGALFALNRAPNLNRRRFGFMGWKDFDPGLFEEVKKEAMNAERGAGFRIMGADISESALDAARRNIERADIKDRIELVRSSFGELQPPEKSGTLIMNPPYGERMGGDNIAFLYGGVGDTLKQKYAGYTAWMLSSNAEALKHVGLRPTRRVTLFNGALECRFQRYLLYEGSVKKKAGARAAGKT